MNDNTLNKLGEKKKELFEEVLSASRKLTLSGQVDDMVHWLQKREKLLEDVKRTDDSIVEREKETSLSLQNLEPLLCNSIKETIHNIHENDALLLKRLHGQISEVQKEQKELTKSSKVKLYLRSSGRAS